ncbi:MAG TPA: VWA domain-containing protein [Vicinamibacteria bacterium]|nr:VWA domain-containing protein [Vicinamibacteria bacterium]
MIGGVGAMLPLLLLLEQAPPVFRAGVESVSVDVFVARKGAPVLGLRAEDFVVKDNGVAQRVEVVDRKTIPTTAVLALDRSASVSGKKLALLRAAARAFLTELRARDEAALLAFDDRIELRHEATTDRSAIGGALDGLEAGGATSVIDALYLSLKRRWGTGLPLVVLFTDGQDSGSWLETEDVLQAARESSTLLHVVGTENRGLRLARSSSGAGISPVATEPGYVYLLRRAAEITGGSYWAVDSDDHLEATFRKVLETANARYVLRYEPRGVARPGLHRIEVSVRRGGVDVRARQEYVIPSSGAGSQSAP